MSSNPRNAVENGAVDNELFNLVISNYSPTLRDNNHTVYKILY